MPPAKRKHNKGGFAVDEDIDHDELAEQFQVNVMHMQEMYAVFKVINYPAILFT
jgi:hypothetical protein